MLPPSDRPTTFRLPNADPHQAFEFSLPPEYVMRVEKILAETTVEHQQGAERAAGLAGSGGEAADNTTDSGAAVTPAEVETPAEEEKEKEKEKEKAAARKVHEMRLNRIKGQ